MHGAEFAIGGHAVTHHDKVLDVLEVWCEFFDGGQQRGIDKQDLIVGVLHDVGQLIAGQPQVERMYDRTHAGYGEVQFQVARVVPREGRHAIAAPHAEFLQRIRQPADAFRKCAIRIAFQARPGLGDDFFPGVKFLRPIEYRRQRQRIIHHLSAHGMPPPEGVGCDHCSIRHGREASSKITRTAC